MRRVLPANPALRWLVYGWVAPASLAGLLLALLALAGGARWRRRAGVLEVDCRRPDGRYGAITFGHVILGRNRAQLATLRAHEQVHVRQYQRWGVLFFAAYALNSLWQWLRGRDPYRDNVFEREAYRLAPARKM